MKKILVIINLLLVALLHSQSLTQSENYIYSRAYLEPVTSDNPNAKQVQSVQYFDGLGRTTQSISIKASPSGKDIVVPSVYDLDGRQTKSLLPLPVDSQNGAYIPGITENTVNSYYGVPNAYSEVSLEKSPFARAEKSSAPGTDWQISGAHTQKAEYLSNTTGIVKKFKANTTWNPGTQINDVSFVPAPDDTYTTGGYYNANTLYQWVTKDEDDNETHTYTNTSKQNILVRQINKKPDGSVENLDTYYVYDDFGNLVLVIPPKAAVASLTPTIIDNLCYQYKYDKYNRLVEKKLPGKGWVYIVYDKQSRVTLVQDGNLRTTNNNFSKLGWVFTKYDQFGRVVYTGFFLNTSTRTAMQTALNNMSSNALNNEALSTVPFSQNGIDVYYTKNAFPTGSMIILNVNYYDEYPTLSPARPSQIQNQTTLSSAPTAFSANGWSSVRSTKTMPTASYVKNVENDSWSSSFIWYDTLGRAVGSHQKNQLGGFTNTESVIDFSGKALEVYTYHSKSTQSTEVTVKDRFVYSPQNYLSKHYQQINSAPEELLSEYTYNDLGQVTNKKTGNNLQSIDYTYNIRGWLTGINGNNISVMGDKLFAYRIKYNTVEGAEFPDGSNLNLKVKPKHNGSIAEIDWKTASGANEPLRRYGYVYDGANRLRAGFFQPETNPYSKEYSEIADYDLNGNISELTRTGAIIGTAAEVMDDLKYSYDGNRLVSLEETGKGNAGSGYPLGIGNGQTITYDSNGNMKSHQDKKITDIAYNFLNLPSVITAESSVNTVRYVYNASGEKVKMTRETEVTDYLGNFQYTTQNGALASSVLSNDEGYYDFVNSRYVYQYKDHLGNIRLSYAKNTNGGAVILEENNYYPFGMKHAGYNTGDATNNKFKYLYNGKELQRGGNLDYGWRQYMPDLGRWNGMDQLSEDYHSTSPYAYVMNNPINMIDPDGRLTQDFLNQVGGSPHGTTWTNRGSYFSNNWGGMMDHEGRSMNYNSYIDGSEGIGFTNGGGGGFVNVVLQEIIMQGKGEKWSRSSNFEYNRAVLESGMLGGLNDWNFDINSSTLHYALENTKIGKSIGEAQAFMFLELPMSFAGGELVSIGWRAAGMSRLICGPLGRLTNGIIKICFTEGTLVTTENGNKKIEDIKEGDLVWSYNEETGKKELKKVVELSRNTSSSLVKISVNGTEITCTPEHPFFVNGNWVEAKNLTKGTLLTTLDGTTSPVESINFLDEKVKVYNFEVEDNHNYYVSEKEILVHNNCEWASAITNTLENSASGMTKHLSEHFFAGEFNIGGRPLSQMFQKGLSYKDVLQEAALRIGKGEGVTGTSTQGAKEVILDFGRAINQSGTTNQVRIWMNEAGTSIRSLHPYLGR